MPSKHYDKRDRKGCGELEQNFKRVVEDGGGWVDLKVAVGLNCGGFPTFGVVPVAHEHVVGHVFWQKQKGWRV